MFIDIQNGQTPLHKACKGKDSPSRSKLLQYLIEKGVDINLQSKVKHQDFYLDTCVINTKTSFM